MSTDTASLIDRLTTGARPVRPLPRPELRALAWLGLAAVVIAVVMAFHGIDAGALRKVLADPRMLGEIAATLVTAVGATFAAFQTTVPGHRRGWLWLPFASLAVWLLLTGGACLDEYLRIGPAAFALRLDTACFVPGAIAGAVVGLVLFVMLRRGAPLVPRLTLMFAGLAVAATVNVGLLLLHEGDVSIMLLIWHTGYVAVLGAIGAAAGRALFGWRHKRAAALK
jgi:hypothetical protein